jgi:hypothetical protein
VENIEVDESMGSTSMMALRAGKKKRYERYEKKRKKETNTKLIYTV